MEKREDNQRGENIGGDTEDWQHRSCEGLDSGKKKQPDLYLACLTKQHLIMLSVAVGLVLLIIITATAVVLTKKSDSSTSLTKFSTGGDMLDFLVQSGVISKPDGLLATWFHRANGKEEMNKALASDVMILEADVTLEGYGTANEKPIPIMAHPPDIYSDNTLDQWLDAVLASKKGIKLDFKSLASVGLSLDLLRQKNLNGGINRPVWLNADILHGPNVPDYMPIVNGTMFSLTLWQGSIHPNVSDLLFIRENTEPDKVYYDIYEPTLSEFKEAANGAGGMLVVRVGSDADQPGVPLVEGSGKSSEILTLQDVLQLLGRTAERWGVYLQVQNQQLLEASLQLLHSAYSREELYRPVWISMSSDNTNGFVSTVELLFPYVTIVLTEQSWPPLIPETVSGLSQRVALHLKTSALPKGREELHSLMGMMDRYDVIVEDDMRSSAEALSYLKAIMMQRKQRANLYVITNQS
ncbi:hypothetical protein PAMP_004346 [Pampus punctatissimus]